MECDAYRREAVGNNDNNNHNLSLCVVGHDISVHGGGDRALTGSAQDEHSKHSFLTCYQTSSRWQCPLCAYKPDGRTTLPIMNILVTLLVPVYIILIWVTYLYPPPSYQPQEFIAHCLLPGICYQGITDHRRFNAQRHSIGHTKGTHFLNLLLCQDVYVPIFMTPTTTAGYVSKEQNCTHPTHRLEDEQLKV